MSVALAENKANGFYDPIRRLIPKPIQAEFLVQKVEGRLAVQGAGRILDELLIFLAEQGAIRAWNILLLKLATLCLAIRIAAIPQPSPGGDSGF